MAAAREVAGVETGGVTASPSRSWSEHPRSWSSCAHGMRSTRWPRSASSFGVVPIGNDFARISPRSLMHRFPKGIVIDGVRLPTGATEVQQILEVLESAETPFERLYEVAG